MKPKAVVTRFAPSPTGLLHAGTYRTAVFSYLFARHHNGTFLLRIEDTDRARSKKAYEDNILDSLAWLGLEYDDMHRQSEWVGVHEEQLRALVQNGYAYVSKEKSEEGSERELIRFKNPNRVVEFNDLIRGPISFDTRDLKDFVIAKDFTEPLFHFVVVADDAAQGVTHIIRGEDHISNTARQILIYEALGKDVPQYAHIPLVLAPDRSKLSKRKGARALTDYRELGYLPEALLNHIALIGWNPGTDEELFTKDELVQRFTLDQVQKSGAIFDETKLKWFNREYILTLSEAAFKEQVTPFLKTAEALHASGRLEAVLGIIRERIQTFAEVREMEEEGEFAYFIEAPTYEAESLVWKKDTTESAKKHLSAVLQALEGLSAASWSEEVVKGCIWPYAEEAGKGSVLWPMRYALTGREKSPDPFTVAGILGKDETISRLERAVQTLS